MAEFGGPIVLYGGISRIAEFMTYFLHFSAILNTFYLHWTTAEISAVIFCINFIEIKVKFSKFRHTHCFFHKK